MDSASDVFMNVSPVDLSEDEIQTFFSPVRGTSPSRQPNPSPSPMAGLNPSPAGSQQRSLPGPGPSGVLCGVFLGAFILVRRFSSVPHRVIKQGKLEFAAPSPTAPGVEVEVD